MSVLLERSNSEALTYATAFPAVAGASFTAMLWVKGTWTFGNQDIVILSDNPTYNGFLMLRNDSSKNFEAFYRRDGGDISAIDTGFQAADDTWYHLAIRKRGTTDLDLLVNAVQTATAPMTGGDTMATPTILEILPDGTVRHIRLWESALSDGEVATDRGCRAHVKTGPWSAWELPNAATLTDSSGNGRTLTAVGTLSDGSNDPSVPVVCGGAWGPQLAMHLNRLVQV